jgi:DDE domain
VDEAGQTIGFLLTEHRDERAATRFLTKLIRRHGVPEEITIDGSEANASAVRSYNEAHGTAIAIRQVKYLNNIVEQDPRGVKRVTRPMLGFKAFQATQRMLAGIELMHMLRKGQKAGRTRPNSGRTVLLPGSLITPLSRISCTPSQNLRHRESRPSRQGAMERRMHSYRGAHLYGLSCEGRRWPSEAIGTPPPREIRGLGGRVAKQGWERPV